MKKKITKSLSIAAASILLSTSAFAHSGYHVNCDSHSPQGDKIPSNLKMEMSGGSYSTEIQVKDMKINLGLVEGTYTKDGRDKFSISITGENDKGYSYASTNITLNDASNPIKVHYYRAPTDLGIWLSCSVSTN